MYTQTQTQSLRAYESVNKATQSGREIEAAVLTKAAVKLKECQDNWDAPDRDNRLEEALKYNQRIWSIFQSELSRENHELPKQLRLDILRLAAFIDRRIFETMAFPSPEKLKIVIDINNNLAAGLRSSP
jgi:flagellar protein FlaF